MSSSYENDVSCPSTPHSSRRKNIVYISIRKYFRRFYMIRLRLKLQFSCASGKYVLSALNIEYTIVNYFGISYLPKKWFFILDYISEVRLLQCLLLISNFCSLPNELRIIIICLDLNSFFM